MLFTKLGTQDMLVLEELFTSAEQPTPISSIRTCQRLKNSARITVQTIRKLQLQGLVVASTGQITDVTLTQAGCETAEVYIQAKSYFEHIDRTHARLLVATYHTFADTWFTYASFCEVAQVSYDTAGQALTALEAAALAEKQQAGVFKQMHYTLEAIVAYQLFSHPALSGYMTPQLPMVVEVVQKLATNGPTPESTLRQITGANRASLRSALSRLQRQGVTTHQPEGYETIWELQPGTQLTPNLKKMFVDNEVQLPPLG